MGFISAVISATGGTLSDQWKEYFYCDSLGADVICQKASKKTMKQINNDNSSGTQIGIQNNYYQTGDKK